MVKVHSIVIWLTYTMKLLPEVLQFFAQSPPTQPLGEVNITFKLKGSEIRKETTKIEKKKQNQLGPRW